MADIKGYKKCYPPILKEVTRNVNVKFKILL